MQSHFSHDTTLWGPRLGITLSSARWQLTLDGGASASRKNVTLGELSFLLASATLFAGPRFALGPVLASVGPAGTLGWARISGQSDMTGVAATSGSSVVGTVGLRAAAEGPATTIVRLLAYVEGGVDGPLARSGRQRADQRRDRRRLSRCSPPVSASARRRSRPEQLVAGAASKAC